MSRAPVLIAAWLACACGHRATATATPAPPWPTPPGWTSETIPFPLGFAPDVHHTGEEELRFPPGFYDRASPGYWSYAFVWRTTDPALLDARALGDELTRYFRGLITAVDAEAQQVKDVGAVVVHAEPAGAGFALTAHVFNAFAAGEPVELTGWAQRTSCGDGALWVFAVAPPASTVRADVDALARAATCR